MKCIGKCASIACTELALSIDEVKNLAKVGKPPKIENGLCNHLKEGKCQSYDQRPVLCRLWGAVESMRCPYGCEAERIMTDGEARDLIRQVFKLSDGKWTDNR